MTTDTADHGTTGQQGPADTMDMQGRLFTDLDRLAFALEMEVAESLQKGNPAKADRLQDQRLGVRLAQRLVSGVWADEVNLRLQRWDDEYERRVGRAVADQEPGEDRDDGSQTAGPEGNGTGPKRREEGAPS